MAVDRHIHSQNGFPKRCIFCGSNGPLTEEDWWPMWLRKYLPSPYDEIQHTSTLNISPNVEERLIGKISPTWKNRGPIFTPLRVVCAECNNGWMSSLQNASSPILKPLIKGKWDELNNRGVQTIASWMTMLSMVYDFMNMPTQSIVGQEREEFRTTKMPLGNWIISLGLMRRDTLHGKIWKRSMLVTEFDNFIVEKCNTQTTTLVIGKLLIHSFSTTSAGVNIFPKDIRDNLGVEVIWPHDHKSAIRPRRKISSFAGFHLIATGVHSIIRDRCQ